MIRTLALLLTLGLLASGAARAAGNPAVGKWDCTSTDSRGTEVYWTLEVTQAGDKLAATITFSHDGSTVQLIDPHVEGNVLIFKLPINANEIVLLKGAIDGKKIKGTFEGHESGNGIFVGTKVSVAHAEACATAKSIPWPAASCALARVGPQPSDSSACSRSARMSSASSMPTDSRTRLSRIPTRRRSAGDISRCELITG